MDPTGDGLLSAPAQLDASPPPPPAPGPPAQPQGGMKRSRSEVVESDASSPADSNLNKRARTLEGRRKELMASKYEEDKGRRTQLYVEAIGTITQKLRLLERRTGLVFLLLAALPDRAVDPVVADPFGGGPPGKDDKTTKGMHHSTVVSDHLACNESTVTLPDAARVETETTPRQWLIALDEGFGCLADRERYKVAVIKAEAEVHQEKERLRLEKEAAEVKLKAVEEAALKAEEYAQRALAVNQATLQENERLRRELEILRAMS